MDSNDVMQLHKSAQENEIYIAEIHSALSVFANDSVSADSFSADTSLKEFLDYAEKINSL